MNVRTAEVVEQVLLQACDSLGKVDESWHIMGVDLGVASTSERLLAALRDYFVSHLGEPSGGRPRLSVRLVSDDGVADVIARCAGQSSSVQRAVISYCSTEAGTHKIDIQELDGGVLARAAKRDVWLWASMDYKDLWFVVRSDYMDAPSIHKDIALLLLHVLQRSLEADGQVQLHASAVVVEGGAVVFAGPKRAGKTTCFLDAVLRAGAAPLAVDKVHLRRDPVSDRYLVVGVPTRLRVLAGTLSKYSGTWDRFMPTEYRDAGPARLWKGESAGKVDIATSYLVESAGREFVTEAPLAAVVLPRIGENRQPALSRLVKHEEITDRISPNVYTPDNPEEDWWSGIGVHSADDLRSQASTAVAAMAADVPVFGLDGGDDIEALVHELCRQLIGREGAVGEA